jgi:hypothetical protein
MKRFIIMVLIVGNIASNILAESAASVEFVDAYHEKRGNQVWLDLDNEIKEQLLIKTGDYMRATYGNSWSTTVIAMPQVPVLMAQAASELALIAKTTPLLTNIKRGKKKVKIGPLEVEYDGESATQTEFVLASRMLTSLLGGGQARGINAKLIRC